MKLDQVGAILEEAAKLTNHRQFVVVGSLSVLGALLDPPPRMVQSVDVDLYPRLDPSRVAEINAALGQHSAFARRHGYYADGTSPRIVSVPSGWEARLIQIAFSSGVAGWFLEPNDAAVAKLMRGEDRDLEWVEAGLRAGVLARGVLEERIPTATNCLPAEPRAALTRLRRLAVSAGP